MHDSVTHRAGTSEGQAAKSWCRLLSDQTRVNRRFGLIAAVFVLALLAGCTGRSPYDGFNFPQEGATSAQFGPRVQLAQASSDFEIDEDDDFGDLFPGDDEFEVEEDYDPLETLNRFLFAFNEALDVFILRPIAEVYRFWLPQGVQDSVRNFTRNLNAPVTFLNLLWQGRDEEASDTIARFFINTTVGLAGLFDPASSWGLEYTEADFGQTMGYYGAGPGPYLVLPIFGPSSVRDGTGLAVDSLLLDPWPHVLNAADVDKQQELMLARLVMEGVDKRARNIETFDDLKRDSVDFYARVRSLYLQYRKGFIEESQAANPPRGSGDKPAAESNHSYSKGAIGQPREK